MNKKQIKELGGCLAEVFESGGSDALMEHYNGFSDFLSDDAQEALNTNSELGEEIEFQMNIVLARRYAKLAGGRFVPNFIPPKGGK
jgi:hypothetical protein